MEKFESLTGTAAALMRDNIDTDSIIPSVWMRSIRTPPRTGLFGGWRYDEQGNDVPEFVLNRAEFRDARILIAGRNFGCGSSRENAAWALLDYGIRCVIAPSFSDIFHENAIKNGLLPVMLDEQVVRRLAQDVERIAGERPLTVDLVACSIEGPSGWSVPFEIDVRVREALLSGIDDITRTLRHSETIAAFQAKDRSGRPWSYPPDAYPPGPHPHPPASGPRENEGTGGAGDGSEGAEGGD